MKLLARCPWLTLGSAWCALLTGCILKPTTVTTRSFVLTPIPAPESAAAAGHLPVGIGLIKIPSYLLRTSMAIRKGTNEIEYSETALWAERLDHSFQRVLAANVATLLPTDQIRLSAWRREEVALAVSVSVEQFDVDAEGSGTLIAWWRITTPDGDKVRKSGETRLRRKGPSPYGDPQTMATTLSDLAAEFSRVLTQAIRESAPVAATGR